MAGIRADVDIGISQRSKTKVQTELNNMFKRMSGRSTGFSISDKSFTQPLGRITTSANEFTKSLEASNARVIAFGASVGVINAVSDAFKGLVLETIQFEKTLSDINVVLNASTSALRGFGDELFNVARNTAQSFNVVAEAALEFSRQGLSMEETLKRTNDALILTRLTSLKAAEAVSGLTAAVNAFGSAGLTTTDIIDKLAAVDVNFAVSSEDLIHALERTGAVAISAGVELDNLIGLVTALQQNTARGGSVIGNGLKTIFTRIQRPESLRQLEEMNIAVRDLSGAILPADQILQNISKSFDSLSQAQQSNLVQFSAGIFQANIFRATLADLSKEQNIFSRASDIAADAAGNAAVKNEALNKTLAAMISQTQSSVKELAGSLGEIMLEDSLKGWTQGFKSLVDGLTNALDGGEGKGSDFAKGFFKGIGNVLTGPVAIAIGVVFIKLLSNVAKFAGQSLKDVLGVTTQKEKMLKMENGILEALSRNKHIQQSLNNLEGDRLAQEEFMLRTIEAQTNAMREQRMLARALAKPLMNKGISPDLTASNVSGAGPVDLDGDGRYETFTAGGLIPKAVKKERDGAIKAGYTPGAVSTMSIDGLGTVVYNKAEKVKKFPGLKQPAIMPPMQSKAGQEYKHKFAERHGFDPYVSSGIIPNFADIKNDVSKGDGAMRLMGTGKLRAPMYIERQISNSPAGQPVNLNVTTKASSLKTKNWKRGPNALSLGEILTALGYDQIKTILPFDFVEGTTGPFRKLPKPVQAAMSNPNNDIKGDSVESLFLSSSAGEGYTSTGGIIPLDSEGAYEMDRTKRSPNANLDAYKKGGIATEIKAGDLDLIGVVKKSIRRYSNTSFRNSVRSIADNFLYDDRPNAVYPDMSNNQLAEELIYTVNHLEKEFIIERLSELAKNGNWSPVGMSEPELASLIANNKLRENLRKSNFTPSQADTELLNSIGFSEGYIPNFASGDLQKWVSNINTLYDYLEASGKSSMPSSGMAEELIGTSDNSIRKQIKGSKIKKARTKVVDGEEVKYTEYVNPTKGKGIHGKLLEYASKDATFRNKWQKVKEALEKKEPAFQPQDDAKKIDPQDVTWRPQQPVKKSHSYEDIQKHTPSLKSIINAGAAFGDTSIGTKDANSLFQKFGGIEKLNKILSNYSYDTLVTPWYPFVGNEPINKSDLWSSGINSPEKFEKLAEQSGQGRRIGGLAPLDFLDSNGEAKFTEGGVSGQKNFKWPEVSGKILRSNIGNDISAWSNLNALISKFKANKTLSTNLFMPAANSGFVPNYAKSIKWKVDKNNNDYSLVADYMSLAGFGGYLEKISESNPEMVSPESAQRFKKRINLLNKNYTKEKEETKSKYPLGFGRAGAKHYAALEANRNAARSVSANDLFIKDLGKHVQHYNRHTIFATDRMDEYDTPFFPRGFMPNFAYENQIELPGAEAINLLQKEESLNTSPSQALDEEFIRQQGLINELLNPNSSQDSPKSTVEKTVDKTKEYITKESEKIPNFVNKIFDKDRLGPNLDKDLLRSILNDSKKKDLLIGPSGVGKSTLASQYGQFIKNFNDIKEASSYTILSGAGKTKEGGISPALREIIESVNQSGGKVSFLSAADKIIEDRREKRIKNPDQDDLRSIKQLKGTRFAPKNQPEFANMLETAASRFELLNAARGNIPNFINLKSSKRDNRILLKMWQEKAQELNFLAQKVKQGSPRIDIDPIMNKVSEDQALIWQQIQLLKEGKSYSVPNFVDINKIKALAADPGATAGERAAALNMINKFSIKSKGMFDDVIIDDFLADPQMPYSGPWGDTVTDYLIAKGYDKDLIIKAAKKPNAYKRASDGFVPNFENVHLKRGQTDPNAPLMEPSINKVLFKPLLSANTPEDMYNKILSFMKAHASGPLSGRSSAGTTGDLGDKLADYISKWQATSDGNFETWEESSDPYSEQWINKELGKEVDPTGFLDMASGAVSYTTRDAIANQFHKSKQKGKETKGKIFETTVPRKNIFGKRKLLKMLNMGARPPKYPILDKVKNSIRDGSFFEFWKNKGGFYVNIDAERNDRSLIDLDNKLEPLRPALARGEIRTRMFTKRFDTIAPEIDRGSGDFYREAEVTRLVNQGLVPNFANPLRDAINRERSAGIPASMIRIDKSRELISPQNPMGLAVINTRDEPRGVQQGISRAKSMGINPKKHGLQVPNFVNEASGEDIEAILTERVVENIGDKIDAALSSSTAVENAVEEIDLNLAKKFKLNAAELKDNVTDAGVIKSQVAGSDADKSSQNIMQKNSAMLLQAENKLSNLQKNAKGNDPKESQDIQDAGELVKQLKGVQDALGQHAQAISGDTAKFIQELKDKGVKRPGDGSDKASRDVIKKKAGPLIQDEIKKGKSPEAISRAVGVARSNLLEKEKVWKETDGNVNPVMKKHATKEMEDARKKLINLKRSEDALKKETEAREGGLQRLFYFQSMISMANGFLQQMSETGTGATKSLADFGMAASSVAASFLQAKELGREFAEMSGVRSNETYTLNPFASSNQKGREIADQEARNRVAMGQAGKLEQMRFSQRGTDPNAGIRDKMLGGLARGLGGAAKGFTRMIPVIGQLYTGFTVVDEAMKFATKNFDSVRDGLAALGFEVEAGEGVMALFKNQSEIAATNIEKLSKASDVATKALEGMVKSTGNNEKINELEALGVKRTISQDRELHTLKMEEMKTQSSVQQSLRDLTDSNIVGSSTARTMSTQLNKINSAGGLTEETLRNFNLTLQKSILLEQGKKAFDEKSQEKFDFFNTGQIFDATLGGLSILGAPLTGGMSLMGLSSPAINQGGLFSSQKDVEINEDVFSGKTERSVTEIEDMYNAMRSRSFEIFEGVKQGLRGGDFDTYGNRRSREEQFSSMQENMKVLRSVQNIIEKGGSDEDAKEELSNLRGSEAEGEVNTSMLREAIIDTIKTGYDMEDNIGSGMLAGEKFALNQGFFKSLIQAGEKDDPEEEERRRQRIAMDTKNLSIQKDILRNHEMMVSNQTHLLNLASKNLDIEHAITSSKLAILKQSGLLLNSVDVETQASQKSAQARAAYARSMNDIRAKESKAINNRLREYLAGKEVMPVFYRPKTDQEQQAAIKAAQANNNTEEVNRLKQLGTGGEAVSYRVAASKVLAGEDRSSDKAKKIVGETFKLEKMGGDKIDVDNVNQFVDEKVKKFFSEAFIFDPNNAKDVKKTDDTIKKAKDFFKDYATDISTETDSSKALTIFQKSLLKLNDTNVQAAIAVMSEEIGMTSASDKGKGLKELQGILQKTRQETETANQTLENTIKQNNELLRSVSIERNTLLGAGFLDRDIAQNKTLENLQSVTNKNLEGEAATQEVRNRINQEKLNILLKSKNFELKLFSYLEKDLQSSAEESITSLKQTQIKNQIFSSNKSLLTSAVSKALLEQEELEISNKEKEVRLSILSNAEKSESYAEENIKSEVLDSEITAKTTEAKRKILENLAYSRILAESQIKSDIENAKISAINSEQKIKAQVANESIAELVEAELKSEISSARTEALKASESALQLALSKEQTKKMQKANELLEMSNKFTAMRNAEMAASRSQEDIRFINQTDRKTEEFSSISAAKSAIDMASLTGNADDKSAAANKVADTERLITGRSGALTALAQKMAEIEVSASSLSAELATNMFDGVRSGFSTLLTDIATGAETAGDAWEKFGLGVAKQLLDRVMEHNIDQMMGNLTYAFTGVDSDPGTQQRLLTSVTSQQTSATKELTKVLKNKKALLEGDISSEDKSSGSLPLATVDPSVINQTMQELGGLKFQAGEAAKSLDALVLKANKLVKQRENISETQKPLEKSQKLVEIQETKALDIQSKIQESEEKQAITSEKIAEQQAKIRKQTVVKENLNKEFNFKSDYKKEDMILASYLKAGTEANTSPSRDRTLIELEKIIKYKDISSGNKTADQVNDVVKQNPEYYKKQAKEMLPEYSKNDKHNIPEGQMYYTKESDTLFKNTHRDNSRYDAEIQKVISPNDGTVEQDLLYFGGKTGFGDKPESSGETNLFKHGDVKEIYELSNRAENNFQKIQQANAEISNFSTEIQKLNSQKDKESKLVSELNQELTKVNTAISNLKVNLSNITQNFQNQNLSIQNISPARTTLPVDTNITPMSDAQEKFFGGKIQHFHEGGFVRGEPGRDKVPAMLTAGEYVIPKEAMQGFREGGRVTAGLKGVAQGVTMSLVAEEIGKSINGEPEDKPPTFDMKKLNAVDIGSDVNISKGDPRMSARALAKDPVIKEYKDYLLKKASYDVQEKNEKFQERMGMLGTVVGAINSFAISQVTDLLKEPINNLVTKGQNFLGGQFGDHSDKFKDESLSKVTKSLGENFKGGNYKDIKTDKDGTYMHFTTQGGQNLRSLWDTASNKWSTAKAYQMGGQVPAMLTAGEMYVPAEMAKRIGYDSLEKINKGGIVDGPGGIDNVGPVGLNPGDFIIRKSSTDKLLKQNPNGLKDSLMGGGFTRRAVKGYYEGGIVGDNSAPSIQTPQPRRSNFDTSISTAPEQELSVSQEKSNSSSSNSSVVNNINVSVKIDSSGKETVQASSDGDGSYQQEKDLSMKIKSAVLEVIRQEKRVGGELS